MRGFVREASTGQPLAGLLVRAFDRDLLVDDALGETRTDASGSFEIGFTRADFQDAFETRPDLYLRVFDPAGRLLHATEIRNDAWVDERYEIEIPEAVLREGRR